ncbi:MAG: thioredoxin [Anaerovoracaceae bacterium]
MGVVKITKDNFEVEVMKSDKPVLVDFWAAWCGPCKMLGPIIEQIEGENPEIKVGKINIDEQPELAGKYSVMSIPSVFLFEEGSVKKTSVGLVGKEELEKLFK